MKNKFAVVLAFAGLIFVVLGCGSLNPLSSKEKTNSKSTASNKTLTDKTIDSTLGDEKIGIPECDDVMDMATAEANNPDDNFVTKAIKATFLNKIKEQIRKSVEEKNSDKVELAKTCKDFKTQLEKYKAEQDSKGK
jgi:hypothetical protein